MPPTTATPVFVSTDPKASIVKVTFSASSTVTPNLALAVLPQLSVAEHETVVVPTGR